MYSRYKLENFPRDGAKQRERRGQVVGSKENSKKIFQGVTLGPCDARNKNSQRFRPTRLRDDRGTKKKQEAKGADRCMVAGFAKFSRNDLPGCWCLK